MPDYDPGSLHKHPPFGSMRWVDTRAMDSGTWVYCSTTPTPA